MSRRISLQRIGELHDSRHDICRHLHPEQLARAVPARHVCQTAREGTRKKRETGRIVTGPDGASAGQQTPRTEGAGTLDREAHHAETSERAAAHSGRLEHASVAARSTSEHPGRTNEGLGRSQRLRSARDFSRVRSRGRRVSSRLLTLTYLRQVVSPATSSTNATNATNATHATRVGFVVGKRVGNAVVRNRVKRRLRESMRRQLSHFPRGWDIIVSARPEAAQADYAALNSELRSLCERAQLSNLRDLRGTE